MRLIAMKVSRLVVVVLIVTFFSFCLIKLVPGDPVTKIIPFGTPQQKAQLRQDLHLNDPFLVQYRTWVTHFFHADFGRYYNNNASVNAQLKKNLPISLQLMLYAQVLALVIAIPLGVVTAYRAGSKLDKAANAVGFGFLALPNFVLGLLLAVYVGAKWKWLPSQGYVPFGENPVLHFKSMILPTVSLAAGLVAVYMRLLRSDMIATLQEDFITTAKAKGIPARRVLWGHALRPSSLTLLTAAGLNIGALIGGAVVIEVIFQLPGVGFLLYEAILAQEYIALQSYIAIIAVFFVVANFAVDLLYSLLDPRIRHARPAV